MNCEPKKEAAMRTAKGESKTAALAAIIIMSAISALAEEKLRRAGTLDSKEDSDQVRRIVVSIQDRKLALLQGDQVIKTWDTAVGADSTPSPSGVYSIAILLSRPTYYHSGKVVPPGPSNPLGTRWLGLSIKGFGIHGTNVPGSIGRKASHGCIRMRNRDVEELFTLVKIGDVVEIYSESNIFLAQIFKSKDPKASSPVLSASSDASFIANKQSD
jgi:lipoprotein-anchoring transpeptidase ErfK/SrfK